jgi:hypothetical protein
MMSVKKDTASLERMLMMGQALIYLENLSTATRRWVKPPGTCWSSPTTSRCQTAKGHVMGMVWSAYARR